MFEYKILEDEVKSDFAFEVIADSLEELFKGAGLATMKAMVNPEEIKSTKEWNFDLVAQDEKMLLYGFLSELIYLKDAETALFGDFDIKIKLKEEFSLKCKAFGSLIDWEKDILFTDVKQLLSMNSKLKNEKINGTVM